MFLTKFSMCFPLGKQTGANRKQTYRHRTWKRAKNRWRATNADQPAASDFGPIFSAVRGDCSRPQRRSHYRFFVQPLLTHALRRSVQGVGRFVTRTANFPDAAAATRTP